MLDITNLGEFAQGDKHLCGKSVLHLAAEYGRATLVAKLLAEKPSLIAPHFSKNVLHLAAKNGHGKVVTKLLAAKPALARQINDDGDTALHVAAAARCESVVALLLAHEPELIDVANQYGETPLLMALCRRKRYVGETSIRFSWHMAIPPAPPALVKCLLAHTPAQVDSRMLDGALRSSDGNDGDEVARMLLQYKPDLQYDPGCTKRLPTLFSCIACSAFEKHLNDPMPPPCAARS